MYPDDFEWIKILCLAVAAAVGAHIAVSVAHALVAVAP
jgi:hypothetical protein